jgi:hypothetical protein
MLKNIISIILAIVIALIVLKLISFAFIIAIKLVRIGIITIIAVPAYFVIKKRLGK